MPGRCPVPGCFNKKGNHRFPKDEKVRKLWLKAARCSINLSINDGVRLCAAHFTNDDYQKVGKHTGVKHQHRLLLKTAVPSIFPWNKRKSQSGDDFDTIETNSPPLRLKMDESTMEQYENMECRVCLKIYDNAIDLNDIFLPWHPPWSGMEDTVVADFVKLTSIEVTMSDQYSKKICDVCQNKLRDAAEFVDHARKSDKLLKEKHLLDSTAREDEQKDWPKPIQVATNINGVVYGNVMQIEIKQEVVSEDENGVCFSDSYMDADIKTEPEEIEEPPPMQIKINETVSLGALGINNNSDEAIFKTTALSQEVNKELLTPSETIGEVLPVEGTTDKIALVDISRLMEAPVKDEPLSDEEDMTEMPMECMLCMKTFASVSGLKAHVIAQHSYKTVKRKCDSSDSPKKRNNKYCCEICKRSFSTRTDLMVHETCHDKYSCYGCDRKFDTFDTLTKHRKRCKVASVNVAPKPKTLDDALRSRRPNSKECSPVPDTKNLPNTTDNMHDDLTVTSGLIENNNMDDDLSGTSRIDVKPTECDDSSNSQCDSQVDKEDSTVDTENKANTNEDSDKFSSLLTTQFNPSSEDDTDNSQSVHTAKFNPDVTVDGALTGECDFNSVLIKTELIENENSKEGTEDMCSENDATVTESEMIHEVEDSETNEHVSEINSELNDDVTDVNAELNLSLNRDIKVVESDVSCTVNDSDSDMKLHLEIHSSNRKAGSLEISDSTKQMEMFCDSDGQ